MTRLKTSKGTSRSDQCLVINGWQLLAHPLFSNQLDKLVRAVDAESIKNPETYKSSANSKLLAALGKLVFNEIPEDPTRAEYRQGATLGKEHKHWFRAKFGNGRFRLFFRYNSAARIIIFAWVNDDKTLRSYGSKTDAYAVFASMLESGNPPDDWNALLSATRSAGRPLTPPKTGTDR